MQSIIEGLEGLKRRKKEIAGLYEQLDEMKMHYLSPRSPKPKQIVVREITRHDLSEYAEQIDQIERNIIERLAQYYSEYLEVISALENSDLSAMQEVILRYRYILCKNWKEIAEETELTTRHVLRLHNQALKILD